MYRRFRIALAAILSMSALASPVAVASEQSLQACQMKARSTNDNAQCFEVEIRALERRLPPGAATQIWTTDRNRRCEKVGNQEGGGGTGGLGIEERCRLDATKARLHAPA